MRCASVRFRFDPSIRRPSGVVLCGHKNGPNHYGPAALLMADEISSTLPHLDLMVTKKRTNNIPKSPKVRTTPRPLARRVFPPCVGGGSALFRAECRRHRRPRDNKTLQPWSRCVETKTRKLVPFDAPRATHRRASRRAGHPETRTHAAGGITAINQRLTNELIFTHPRSSPSMSSVARWTTTRTSVTCPLSRTSIT